MSLPSWCIVPLRALAGWTAGAGELMHAAAIFAAFFAFRELSMNESSFCFTVWK
jgi:hypothetical protein